MRKEFNINEQFPLIAIIRGVLPENVIRVASILIEEGFTMIEVPLNSPDALVSIKKLVDYYLTNQTQQYFVGAGTVTTPELAKAVIATGANLVVTPNMNEDVIKLSVQAGCATFPGIVTPTEAFSALAYGATGIKLFPVSSLGLDGFKALNSVLPRETLCFPVGGIDPSVASMKPLMDIGAQGFGLGSSLFKPTMTDDEIRTAAKAFVTTFKQLSAK
ncbi:2-dehydro-3-deoxy-6-phosphogalactonate aldolase [Colwellia sp. 1_MG-2023]|uniref:2-dehydro-3-deoxy-6-phosphogalactonate aldolase n=1 Tax=unclassified Colwellia TaxID=196834 RepID=UPI001C08D97C|nr:MULTISPECIES: 2-dehydro-3-deoxy-6-phosphogalactonate aldolase [unclassified Colwellia]MBU2924839.1 2-dehydro-3-deoxy-6-phosphogalactonate aldolase [Colwellia sp. C2M11]MDO6654073.1 2-dehydro-3-deoxy-6-phosphogalactonate aldolase [Colwellia sp. 3_MG-2023]MDO6665491.1 2-dehydro-3-deoxy-6-phosphogalactonate aldolase [Colwellia sp. 2_MG-2023]MDO6689750.1 2-dehydro-3-deoxy-6-phosphogalactonate aldolase [Colwellia sp. 1_MG-2023]